MKKIFNWVLAATLVCSPAAFTSCTSGSEDNPGQEQAKKNRKEFVQHTRASLKTLAENLNFRSWDEANKFNTYLNEYVLNNPEFNRSVIITFIQQAYQNVKPVEAGSELSQMGYKMYGTVDLTNFNYRFTMNDDMTGFDVEPADDFEVLLSGWSPLTQKIEKDIYKIVMKSSGTVLTRVISSSRMDGMAVVLRLSSDFQFAVSNKVAGTWIDNYTGTLHYSRAEGATDASKGYDASATINSHIPAAGGKPADDTQLYFAISSDRVNGHATSKFSYVQNDRKLIELSMKESGNDIVNLSNIDLKNFTQAASIFDVIAAILGTRSIDEASLTLLDDLTTNFSISNIAQAIMVQHKSKEARRNYADQQTIDQYTQQLNQLMSAKITCKGLGQEIPMRLVTEKFGVDYVTMPAFNFSDENGYVSLVDLLDAESMKYAINIVDHSAEPLQQSVIVARQLLQFLQSVYSAPFSIEE